MPMNEPKTYAFMPTGTGPVKLLSRSSRRSRLWAGGSFWRSVDRGMGANLIKISCVEDGEGAQKKGLLVVHNTVLNTDEQVSSSGFAVPLQARLSKLDLNWDQEIRIIKEGDSVRARKYGIRWQIAGESLLEDLGEFFPGKLFISKGVTFQIDATEWPNNANIVLRPRVHRYPLVVSEVTDPLTAISSMGWSIQALRATLNESDTWVKMPRRSATMIDGTVNGSNSDDLDDGSDAVFLSAFDPVYMTGGDGLPATPSGYNTGPFRTLVHLNYAERDNGSMGEVNQIYEWVGDTATQGSWKLY